MNSIIAESIIYIQKLSEIPKAKFPISLSGKLRAKVIKLSPVLIHWENMCLPHWFPKEQKDGAGPDSASSGIAGG